MSELHNLALAVGIDVGTSSAKGVVLRGVEVASTFWMPLWPPSNTSELFAVLQTLLTKLLLPEQRSDVRSICISGRAPTLVGIRADGPEGPVVGWGSDPRTGEGGFYLDSLARWLMENDRDLYESCRFFVNPHEYLSYRLTGIARSSAPNELYHPWGGYQTEAAKRIRNLRVNPAKIAPAVTVGTILGRMPDSIARRLSMDSSTAVVMGGWDFMMDTLGSGVSTNGEILVRAGTTLSVNSLWSQALTSGGFFSTPHFIPSQFLVGKVIEAGPNRIAQSGEASEPRGRSRRPWWTRTDFAADRAATVITSLTDLIGPPSSIVCTGQNALSTGFCRELTKAIQRPVERIRNSLSEARGAAIVASIAAGLTLTYEDHIREIRSSRERITSG